MTLMSGDKGKVARPKSASSAQSHKSAMQTVTHFSSGALMTLMAQMKGDNGKVPGPKSASSAQSDESAMQTVTVGSQFNA